MFSEAIKPPATPTASTDKSDKTSNSPKTSEEEAEKGTNDSVPLLQEDLPDGSLGRKKKKKKKKTSDELDDESAASGSCPTECEMSHNKKMKKGKRKFDEDEQCAAEEMSTRSKKKKRLKVEVDSNNGGSAIMEIAEALGKKEKKAKENDLVIANEHALDDSSPLPKQRKIATDSEPNCGEPEQDPYGGRCKNKKSKKAKKHKHSDSLPLNT